MGGGGEGTDISHRKSEREYCDTVYDEYGNEL